MTGWKSLVRIQYSPLLHRNDMHFTYVLYSSLFNKIYIGFSSDVQNRLLIHNDTRNTGWTAKFQPWNILFYEEYATKSEAMKREKQLKTSRGRAFIWEEVNSRNQKT
jgi:putative endonuclease